jgi:hypothetical protein
MAWSGKRLWVRTPVILGILTGLFVALGGAGGHAVAARRVQLSSQSDGPLRPTKIVWYAEPTGRRATVRVEGGYCVGEEPPTVARIRIREKPALGGGRTAKAIVTVFLSGEQAHEPGAVTGGERSPEQMNLCLGVGEQIDSSIKFKRPVERLSIFDGSAHPPRPIPLRHPG